LTKCLVQILKQNYQNLNFDEAKQTIFIEQAGEKAEINTKTFVILAKEFVNLLENLVKMCKTDIENR